MEWYISSSQILIDSIKKEIESYMSDISKLDDTRNRIFWIWRYRHRVGQEHDTVKKILKYKEIFSDSPEDMKLLESMVVISDEELLLWNWMVLKIHAPYVEANWVDIFEENWRHYFKHSTWLNKYLKIMAEDWFEIPKIEIDKNWTIINNEFLEIFNAIPWSSRANHNEIICEFLNRSFWWVRELDGTITPWNEAWFWSATKVWEKDAMCCHLFKQYSKIFTKSSKEYWLWVLLFKRHH